MANDVEEKKLPLLQEWLTQDLDILHPTESVGDEESSKPHFLIDHPVAITNYLYYYNYFVSDMALPKLVRTISI
jgi:hypothetical protein